MAYILLAVGFVILIVAGDVLVRGATAMAERLGIPALIIGLTIVAFGTSAPELVVALQAASSDAPGIAIGNVVGSNIANVLLVLALPAIFYATDCCPPNVRSSAVFMVLVTAGFIGFCFQGVLGFWAGLALFSGALMFLLVSGLTAARHRPSMLTTDSDSPAICPLTQSDPGSTEPSSTETEPMRWSIIAALIVVGLIGLPIGADLVVSSATELALSFGVSETAVGLTIVALGTSLPELATTLMAAVRGQGSIAIGNIIGSNLFNLLAVMGITGMFTPIPVPEQLLRFDLWIMMGAALLVIPITFLKIPITRVPATLLVLAYAGYVSLVFNDTKNIPATLDAKTGILAKP